MSPAAAAKPPPNVLVILIDDARVDDLSTMPNATSLVAAEGATFANSFAPFPLCCPARATLLTGQYAHNHGVLGNDPPWGGFAGFDDSETVATWLQDRYWTGFVGKYLNGYGANGTTTYVPPGWDVWHGALQPTVYLNPRFNDGGTVNTYSDTNINDVVADLAVEFVGTRRPDPFFLFASFPAPHAGTPVEPDDPQVVFDTTGFATPNVEGRYRNAFDDLALATSPSFNEADMRDKPLQPPLLEGWQIEALTEVNQQRRESLLYVDDAIGRIVDTLEDQKELDNTYIVITSDNGFMLGEHRDPGGKSTPYEEAVGVPLLIRGPGIPAGSVVTQQVGGQDLAPTLLEIAGLSPSDAPLTIDGIDVLPLITDPSLHADRPIVLEWGPTNSTGNYQFHGIRTPQWKYVERMSGAVEMYDMVRDPYELNNRADRANWAAIQAEYDALLDRYMYCSGSGCW